MNPLLRTTPGGHPRHKGFRKFLGYSSEVNITVSDEQWDALCTDVYRWATRKRRPGVEPKDVAQEATFRGIRWWKQTGKPYEEVRAYTFTCAKNWLIDETARAAERAEHERLDEQETEELSDDEVDEELPRRLLAESALQKLDDFSRDVIYMHYFLSFEYREIGQVLGEKSSTIRMRAKRALEKLRREMGDGGNND